MNEIGAVAASPGRYEDVLMIRPPVQHLIRRSMARQKPDERHPRPHRCGDFEAA